MAAAAKIIVNVRVIIVCMTNVQLIQLRKKENLEAIVCGSKIVKLVSLAVIEIFFLILKNPVSAELVLAEIVQITPVPIVLPITVTQKPMSVNINPIKKLVTPANCMRSAKHLNVMKIMEYVYTIPLVNHAMMIYNVIPIIV